MNSGSEDQCLGQMITVRDKRSVMSADEQYFSAWDR